MTDNEKIRLMARVVEIIKTECDKFAKQDDPYVYNNVCRSEERYHTFGAEIYLSFPKIGSYSSFHQPSYYDLGRKHILIHKYQYKGECDRAVYKAQVIVRINHTPIRGGVAFGGATVDELARQAVDCVASWVR